MRPSRPGSNTRRGSARGNGAAAWSSRLGWLAVFWAGLVAPARAQAPAGAAPQPSGKQASAAAGVPLSRYVPKDNLIVYVEFAGIDAHADAWQKTSAYRMLNETPLGVMLEAVSGQLLDKWLAFVPNHPVGGTDLVTLFKHATRSGWVVAIGAGPKGSGAASTGSLQGALVLRGGAGKDVRSVTSRLVGWCMGNQAKPTIKQTAGRTIVVPPAAAAAAGAKAGPGWVWWAEQTDLVVALFSPASADAIIASIDGKVPCAAEHPAVVELKKPEGNLAAVCIAFADLANCPNAQISLTDLLRGLHSDGGIQRIDYRWGFDDDALMAVTRLVAPKPRKPLLAIFDQPTFDKTTLMPRPEGVDSFIELSTSPSQIVDVISALWPESEVKSRIDDLAETIRAAGQIDLNKDLLAHLGPRMLAYVGPGRSAMADDDSLESAIKNGLSPTAAVAALQAAFPKLTLIAEVKKPEAFSKALDAAVIAINSELKAQAIEKAKEAQASTDQPAAGGRAGGGRMGGSGTKRKRSLNDTRAPAFTLTPSTDQTKTFVLTTPIDSPIKFGPSHFRPTIQLDGKYFTVALSPDAARAALAAVRKKDWKPSANVQKATEHAASNLVMLGVADVGETLPSLLASLPGTLQTRINTAIAVAKAGLPGNLNQAGGGGRPAQGAASAAAPGARMGGPLGRARPGVAAGLGARALPAPTGAEAAPIKPSPTRPRISQ